MTPRETTKCFLRRMSYFPRCPRCCMGVAPVVVFVFSDQNVWAVCALNVCLCAPPGLQMAVKVTKSFTNNTTVLRAPLPDPIASTTILLGLNLGSHCRWWRCVGSVPPSSLGFFAHIHGCHMAAPVGQFLFLFLFVRAQSKTKLHTPEQKVTSLMSTLISNSMKSSGLPTLPHCPRGDWSNPVACMQKCAQEYLVQKEYV